MNIFGTTKGQDIVCPNGHRAGNFCRDMAQGETITPDDIALISAEDHTPDLGHCCPECGEIITRDIVTDREFAVRTQNGWVGRVDRLPLR